MSKKFAVKLSIIILLLSAINSCYYERETDQQKVCYIRSGSIWVMNIDGSEQNNLTNSTSNDFSPSWSPDGKKILFVSDRDGNNEIYIINSDGSGLKQLTHTSGTDTSQCPTWSSDGEEIFFAGERSGDKFIFIAKADGTILKSFSIGSSVFSLTPSPDGKYIYYSPGLILRKIDIEKGTDDYLKNNPQNISVSPDGKSIAFSDLTSISIYDINTNNFSTFLPSGTQPCWTPNGKTILYDYNLDIFSINIDGTNNRNLTKSGFSHSPCVKWKPK